MIAALDYGLVSFRLRAWLAYQLRAQGSTWLHSPFVYRFHQEVLKARPVPALLQPIEQMRTAWLTDHETILELTDYGAGFAGKPQLHIRKTLADITKSSARSVREGVLLHRLMQFIQPQYGLELGTNLGFSAAYQVLGLPNGLHLQTIEGSVALVDYAHQLWNALGINNQVESHIGAFDQVLPTLLRNKPVYDYVFIDGHHSYHPTLRYATQLMPHLRDGGVLILDDIYWSPEMTRAWEELCNLEEVFLSIDLFALGLLFVRQERKKQHFILRW
jgi:predicted O-methyltransferase YrrM